MAEDKQLVEKIETPGKTVEKYYIEVNSNPVTKFFNGLIGGIGWGIGLTVGTGVLLYLLGMAVAKVDFVPIFGNFLADVVKSAQGNLISK